MVLKGFGKPWHENYIAHRVARLRRHAPALAVESTPDADQLLGEVGPRSHLYSYATMRNGYSVRVYVLGWRDGRVKATIFVAGLKSGASPQDAVRLARKQERRIMATMHS